MYVIGVKVAANGSRGWQQKAELAEREGGKLEPALQCPLLIKNICRAPIFSITV
jgi:hypothetical protein